MPRFAPKESKNYEPPTMTIELPKKAMRLKVGTKVEIVLRILK